MTPPDLPTVTLTAAEAAWLARLSPRASFSCSPTGDVWPEHTRGLHRPAQRQQLRGRSPGLDRTVQLVLAIRTAGGRFLLGDGLVRLADRRRPIAVLHLLPARPPNAHWPRQPSRSAVPAEAARPWSALQGLPSRTGRRAWRSRVAARPRPAVFPWTTRTCRVTALARRRRRDCWARCSAPRQSCAPGSETTTPLRPRVRGAAARSSLIEA